MGAEVVLHDLQGLGLGIMGGLEVDHKLGIVLGRASLGDLNHSLTGVGLKGNQEVADPFAFIMMIVAPFLARFHGDRHQEVPQQLTGTLIETPQGAFRIIRLLIEV